MSRGASLRHGTSEEATTPCEKAYVALAEPELRRTVAGSLREIGWEVVEVPSGYHLLEHLAVPLLDRGTHPQLVVVDAFSPGCSGLTIAQGTIELGWETAVLMVTRSAAHRDRAIVAGVPAELVVEPADALERARALASTIADSDHLVRRQASQTRAKRRLNGRRMQPSRSQPGRSRYQPLRQL
jgi:DNA-binding response OmpR family regulator